jgi:hypothetical protein
MSAVLRRKLGELQLAPPSVDCATTPKSPDIVIKDPCLSSEYQMKVSEGPATGMMGRGVQVAPRSVDLYRKSGAPTA